MTKPRHEASVGVLRARRQPEAFTEKVLAFLGEMGIAATKPKFYVEINLESKGEPSMVYWSNRDIVFRVDIRPTQWELTASKPKKESRAIFYANEKPWIASDALGLFKPTPKLADLPKLLAKAEKKLGVTFPRVAYVRTNLAGGKKAVAKWLASL